MLRFKLLTLLAISAIIFTSCEDKKENPIIPLQINPRLYVANSLGETISLIDLEADTVINDLYQTGITPGEIDISGDYLYIANSGDNTLQRIMLETGVSYTTSLGDNRNPVYFEFIDDFAAVSNWVSGTVSIVDLAAGTVEDEIAVGAGPWDMVVSGDKLFIGVSNYDMTNWIFGQGQLVALNLISGVIDTVINIGTNPGPMFIDNEGELNVVCIGDYFSVFAKVYSINVDTYAVIDTLDLGGSPSYAKMNEEGIVYLGAGGWTSEAYVTSYDSNTETVLRSAANPIVIPNVSGAQGVAIDGEGFIYVCCLNSDMVVKLNSAGTVLEEYAVGDGPQAILYAE